MKLIYDFCMCRIVGFVGVYGGIGTTSIIFDLSKRLSANGYKVCVVDACFNNNDLSFKYEKEKLKDLKEWVVGSFDDEYVLNRIENNLCVIKTNSFKFDYFRHCKMIVELIKNITNKFDFVLIDLGVFDDRIIELIFGLNEIFIISGDDKRSVMQISKLHKKFLFYNNLNNIKIVVNKANLIGELGGRKFLKSEIETMTKLEVLKVIPKFFKHNYFNYKIITKKQLKIMVGFCNNFITNKSSKEEPTKMYVGFVGFFRRRLHEKFE